MEPQLEATSRLGVVTIDQDSLRTLLNRALPFYLLYTNEMFAEPLINNIEILVDDEPATCNVAAIVGDSEEPVLVILHRIYDKRLNTFIVLEYVEGVSDDPEWFTRGSLEPRQTIYTVDGYDSCKPDHTIRLVRQLI